MTNHPAMRNVAVSGVVLACALAASLLLGCQNANSDRRVDLMVLTDQVRPMAKPPVLAVTTQPTGTEINPGTVVPPTEPTAAEPKRTILATLPLNIRIAWVERDSGAPDTYGDNQPGYLYERWQSYDNRSPNQGPNRSPQYVSVRSTPELEELLSQASARLAKLSEVAGAMPARGLELSKPMLGDAVLRAAAERSKGDLLIVATGAWHNKSDSVPLTQFFSLGLLPSRWETSEATAEAILLDVRGGEVLYRWSVQADATQLCNSWTANSAAKDATMRAQGRLMDGLLATLENRWPEVLAAVKAGPGVQAEKLAAAATKSAPVAQLPTAVVPAGTQQGAEHVPSMTVR